MTTSKVLERRSEVRRLPSRRPRGPIAPRPRLCQLAGLSPAGHTVFARSRFGGGTGAIAVRLARLGLHVTLLDAFCQCWISRSVPPGSRSYGEDCAETRRCRRIRKLVSRRVVCPHDSFTSDRLARRVQASPASRNGATCTLRTKAGHVPRPRSRSTRSGGGPRRSPVPLACRETHWPEIPQQARTVVSGESCDRWSRPRRPGAASG